MNPNNKIDYLVHLAQDFEPDIQISQCKPYKKGSVVFVGKFAIDITDKAFRARVFKAKVLHYSKQEDSYIVLPEGSDRGVHAKSFHVAGTLACALHRVRYIVNSIDGSLSALKERLRKL